MEKKRALAAFMAAVSTLTATGCTAAQSELEPVQQPVEDARFTHVPEKNGDGNYNILFITTDQEHYFAEYPEGSEYQARKLLEDIGTTFEKHYACSNMSTSSRSVIYTGTHITDTEMLDNTDFPWQGELSTDQRTIGDRLREAGLYTAYKGKWHMSDTSVLIKNEDPVDIDMEQYGFADWNSDRDYIGEAQEGYRIDPVIVADSVEWLKTTGTKVNQEGQSFFLAVNLINPHDVMNLVTEDDFVGTTMELMEAPENKVYEKTYDVPLPSSWQQNTALDGVFGVNAYKANWSRNMGGIDEHNFVKLQDYYFNCIQDSDNNLMTLLTELDNLHMLDNTIIVFTSDHGEMQGAHGLKNKGGFVYDNNIHVPMVIYHPDYEGGRRIDAITSHLDLAPTFIDMTFISDEQKAELSEGLRGVSMMDLMDGSAESIRDGTLFCYEMLSMALSMGQAEDGSLSISIDNRSFVRAIITEDYKFARYFSPLNFNTPVTMEELLANNDVELYDLKNDPDEMNNLALDPEQNEALMMELNARLNTLIEAEVGVDDGSEMAATMDGLEGKLMAFVQMLYG